MAWIESHQELREHPKVYDLAAILNIPKVQVLGHLHLLWWWCVDYALDGVISRTDSAVARAAEWGGDAKAFVDGLVAAGFLERQDGGVVVHDWITYCGSLVEKRLERRNKNRRTTVAARSPKKSVQSPKPPERTPTLPNPTEPNQTKDLAPNDSAALTPEILKPETPIQILVRGWKIQSGVDPNDKAWDKVHFARNSAPAKKLLDLFAGDVDAALDCIEVVHKQLVGKNGFSLSLEGVVKNSDRFRQEWLERKSQFERRETSGLLR